MSAPIHIYRATNQPATRFVIDFGDAGRHWFRSHKRSLVRCYECGARRWAGYCVVQVYGDGVRYFCRRGKGCTL